MNIPLRVSQASVAQRIGIRGRTAYTGIRTVGNPTGHPAIITQALSRGTAPYFAEFDLPNGVFGYAMSVADGARKRALKRLQAPNLLGVITFSEWARDAFGLYFGRSVRAKCEVVYPLVSIDLEREPSGSKPITFIFISSQFMIKGGPQAVRAFARLREAEPTVTMTVITNLEEARGSLGPLTDYESITWIETGIGEEEIATLLTSAVALVHPTLSDSFGMVVLEAMAAGCLIISTHTGSIPELVSNEVNGVLLRPPISAESGYAVIPGLANARRHAAHIRQLDLFQLEDELLREMSSVVKDKSRTARMMHASRKKFNDRYSRLHWRTKLSTLLSQLAEAESQDRHPSSQDW